MIKVPLRFFFNLLLTRNDTQSVTLCFYFFRVGTGNSSRVRPPCCSRLVVEPNPREGRETEGKTYKKFGEEEGRFTHTRSPYLGPGQNEE